MNISTESARDRFIRIFLNVIKRLARSENDLAKKDNSGFVFEVVRSGAFLYIGSRAQYSPVRFCALDRG